MMPSGVCPLLCAGRSLQAHEGLLTSDYGIECKQRYLGFARAVDAYMTKLYQDWEARVQNTGKHTSKTRGKGPWLDRSGLRWTIVLE